MSSLSPRHGLGDDDELVRLAESGAQCILYHFIDLPPKRERTDVRLDQARPDALVRPCTPTPAEYIAQSCYHRQLYRQSLDTSLEILAPEGVDNREILDLALRCCLKLGDTETGERLARGCRSKVSSSAWSVFTHCRLMPIYRGELSGSRLCTSPTLLGWFSRSRDCTPVRVTRLADSDPADSTDATFVSQTLSKRFCVRSPLVPSNILTSDPSSTASSPGPRVPFFLNRNASL